MKSKPVAPPGWSKTLAELLAENRGLSGDEIAWARAYERDQLRAWARFPEAGEVYELLDDAEVAYVTHWEMAYTGGGKGLLGKGTRVRISEDGDFPEPIAVAADPVDKAAVETALIPESDRLADKYAGFSLSIRTDELNKNFRLIK